jgi:hypothetical protein
MLRETMMTNSGNNSLASLPDYYEVILGRVNERGEVVHKWVPVRFSSLEAAKKFLPDIRMVYPGWRIAIVSVYRRYGSRTFLEPR